MGNMTRDELLVTLRALQQEWDHERAHRAADEALLKFIGDPEATEAYEAITRWYA